MRILAVIPARGGSKGIPRKNICPLAGRPLIAYSILAAHAAKCLDRTVVSSDDDEILAVSRALGAEVLMRPAALADDQADTREVLLHVVREMAKTSYVPDAVMTLQPTSPLRTAAHIDDAIALFEADATADSLVSCIPVPHIFNPYSVMRKTPEGYLESFLDASQPTRRQDKEPAYARNGAAIYITRTGRLPEFIYGGRIIPYLMDEESSIDIDTPADLAAAERRLRDRI
ncbi:CMP-N-acetylneuraminic acid synthetase [Candidatus Propionivibrio aalborgensis]|uniref:CMP-N-acetylneuraminic acid synthetase n=1 Tax=Candidatus Propionivibrio aalborgensis TaxID=1860101 RepID=A0A1A8XXK0_9RHOO|nr:acylneuraminate cytidylyltransferase family protein [Candidatus Propionivibrio aalborgensis]SBT09372.1 CMP-N-acetylneuraminic acid synthetase [Candidatus Propionivibrio aalborgensis]